MANEIQTYMDRTLTYLRGQYGGWQFDLRSDTAYPSTNAAWRVILYPVAFEPDTSTLGLPGIKVSVMADVTYTDKAITHNKRLQAIDIAATLMADLLDKGFIEGAGGERIEEYGFTEAVDARGEFKSFGLVWVDTIRVTPQITIEGYTVTSPADSLTPYSNEPITDPITSVEVVVTDAETNEQLEP